MQELGYVREVQVHLDRSCREQSGHSMMVAVRNSSGQEKTTIARVSALAKINEAKLISLTISVVFRAPAMSCD